MIIEYCCTKKWNAGNSCHHNIKIDSVKQHIIDIGCLYEKKDIKQLVTDQIIGIENGWVYTCGDEKCQIL